MSTEGVAPSPAPEASSKKVVPKKASTKPKAVKHTASHPTYGEMIKTAIQTLKEKKGSSRAAILKYILQNYKVGDNLAAVNGHLRLALKRGVASNTLKQTKGTGASGSFRLAEHKADGKVKNAKKPTVKKSLEKKPAAKKVAKPKSPKKKVAKKPKSESNLKKAKASQKKTVASPKKAIAKKVKKAKVKAAKKVGSSKQKKSA